MTRRIVPIGVPVVLGLVVVYVLLFGWSFAGYPDPVPWVKVINNGPRAVTVQLWNGGPIYRSDCGSKETFGEWGHFPALPPWHITVRDASSGRLLGETYAWGFNGWIAVDVAPSEAVRIVHVSDLHGSGPVPYCAASGAFPSQSSQA